MAQLGWQIDLTKCIGCSACALSCKAENNTAPAVVPANDTNAPYFQHATPVTMAAEFIPKHVSYRWVLDIESGSYPNPSRTFVTMSCNHCDEPACMKSCPVNAISKRESDGIVLIDYDKCIGCRYCEWVCPYGAPQYNEDTKKVEKCTFCVHRIDAGLPPACVSTCVGEALTYGELDSLEGDNTSNAPDGFADPSMTIPSVKFVK